MDKGETLTFIWKAPETLRILVRDKVAVLAHITSHPVHTSPPLLPANTYLLRIAQTPLTVDEYACAQLAGDMHHEKLAKVLHTGFLGPNSSIPELKPSIQSQLNRLFAAAGVCLAHTHPHTSNSASSGCFLVHLDLA